MTSCRAAGRSGPVTMISRRLAALGAGLCLLTGGALAQRAEMMTTVTELKVCADPSNLPFSNQAQAGFENKIAAVLAADLQLPLSYVWYPQTLGFVRNTIRARRCDLVMGTVAGDPSLDTTDPYYHTGYMVVTREADGLLAGRSMTRRLRASGLAWSPQRHPRITC